jgi:hypothetical protein
MRFSTFSIDGGGSAGLGLLITATTAEQRSEFSNFLISNCTGFPGIGLYLAGNPGNRQVSENTVREFVLADNIEGLKQDGSQTGNDHIVHGTFSGNATYDLHVAGGFLDTDGLNFISAPATAQVQVDPGSLWLTFKNSYHETAHGSAYVFAADNQIYPTHFDNVRILWLQPSGNVIDYRRNGPVLMTGNRIEAPGANNGVISLTRQSFVGGNIWVEEAGPSAVGNITYAGMTTKNEWMRGNWANGMRLGLGLTPFLSAPIGDGVLDIQPATGGGRLRLRTDTTADASLETWEDKTKKWNLGSRITAADDYTLYNWGHGYVWRAHTGTRNLDFGGSISLGSLTFATLGMPANGTIVVCTDCDAPASPGATCTSAASKAGAEAHRTRDSWICF